MKIRPLIYAFLGMLFFVVSCSTPQKTEEQTASQEPAEEMKEEKAETPKYGVIVTHAVADFDKWLEGFIAADSVLSANGFAGMTVHRSADDSMQVTVTGYTSGHEGAKAFISSEDTRQNMEDAGVVGEPAVSLWDMTWQREGAGDSNFEQVLMVSHDVADPVAWMGKFQEHDSTRLANGVVALVTGANADNPNNIGVYLGVTDLEKWTAFAEESDFLKTAMEEAGVVGEANVNLLNLVSYDKPVQ